MVFPCGAEMQRCHKLRSAPTSPMHSVDSSLCAAPLCHCRSSQRVKMRGRAPPRKQMQHQQHYDPPHLWFVCCTAVPVPAAGMSHQTTPVCCACHPVAGIELVYRFLLMCQSSTMLLVLVVSPLLEQFCNGVNQVCSLPMAIPPCWTAAKGTGSCRTLTMCKLLC
jgi:hypothetical protein